MPGRQTGPAWAGFFLFRCHKPDGKTLKYALISATAECARSSSFLTSLVEREFFLTSPKWHVCLRLNNASALRSHNGDDVQGEFLGCSLVGTLQAESDSLPCSTVDSFNLTGANREILSYTVNRVRKVFD